MDLLVNQDALTMTSIEIADLTGREHRNVMRDIRNVLDELHGEGGVLSFEHTHVNPQNGQTYPIFKLPKRETLILISGYNVQMRAKIIDRWQELEAATANPIAILNDPAAMRGLLLNYTEKVIALEERVADLSPKAEALDRIASAEGLTSMTVAAKLVGMPPRKFIQHLHAHQWIYRSGSGWVGREDRVRQGLIDHKYHAYIGSDGHERQKPQVYLTPKGVAKLTVLLGGKVAS